MNTTQGGNKILFLTAPEAFSFAECMIYLNRSSLECLHRVEQNAVFRSMKVGKTNHLLKVFMHSSRRLGVEFVNGSAPESARAAAVETISDWFDLATDLKPFYRLAKRDEMLRELTVKYYGLRLIGMPDLLEAICWAILGQQINLTFAYTLKRRLVESYGEHVEWRGQKHWLFPAAEAISELTVAELMKLQMTGKKSEYIIECAGRLSRGELSKERLLASGFDAARETLLKIRGIGPWTANYVLMKCLRDPSAFLIQDVGLHNAIKKQLGLDKKPTLEEIVELGEGWTNWQAYATFYLWRSMIC